MTDGNPDPNKTDQGILETDPRELGRALIHVLEEYNPSLQCVCISLPFSPGDNIPDLRKHLARKRHSRILAGDGVETPETCMNLRTQESTTSAPRNPLPPCCGQAPVNRGYDE